MLLKSRRGRSALAILPLLALSAAPPLAAAPAKPAAAKPASGAGDVTRAQMRAEARRVFQLADTDRNGFMDAAEFRTRMGAVLNRTPPGTPGAPTKGDAQRMLAAADAAFRAVDGNGDGKLSLTEATARPLAAFDAVDADRNGVVTVAEKLVARTPPPPPAAPASARKREPGR